MSWPIKQDGLSGQNWLKSLPGREILPLYGTYIRPFPSPSMRLLEILESIGVHCWNRQHKGPSLRHILFCLNPPSSGSVGLCDWFSVYSFSFFSFYALSCSSLLSITLCFPGLTYADGTSSAGIVLSLTGQVTVSFKVPMRALLPKPALCS